MNKKVKLGALLAVTAVAPAIVAPQLVAPAQAQQRDVAEYPDVPRGHWAYEALNKLSQAGIIEGRPGGNYYGNQPMTRYEFAVAIARLLENLPNGTGVPGPVGPQGPKGDKGDPGTGGPAVDAATRTEVNDLIAALRREFADELARLGVRVGDLENRVSLIEAQLAKPARFTVTPSFLHRSGAATYIGQATGRVIFQPNTNNVPAAAPGQPQNSISRNTGYINGKFSYTDFELRLTDRVTDRLSVNAALRSLGSTQEDSWVGDTASNINVREAFATANLGERSFLGLKGWNLILGRQRTKIAQGLLYDNDLAPTDQIQSQFSLGPVKLTAILGDTNNNAYGAGGNAYLGQGSAFFYGANTGVAGSGSLVGFPNGAILAGFANDNESLLRASGNLFKIAGNPVVIGATKQFDGVQSQRGTSFDLSLPLFNRTVGFEYVKQDQYANGANASSAHAYNVTVPVLRSRVLDLNFAYGKASNNYEYFLSSAANPYARTYGEALFDRQLALGAPMINNGANGLPTYMSAKKTIDFSGTLRILRRIPLDYRYYTADGTGGQDLGHVWTVGSTFNITPGLDLEVKYGQYDPENYQKIRYFRVGANVGF